MKIHGQQLARQLRGDPAPLYWLSGDETLLVQEAGDKIRSYCREHDYVEREIWHIDRATDWQALLLSANNLSLFSTRKILELRFATGKPGDPAVKALCSYLGNHNPDCVLLATSPKLESSATRSKGFKQLESACLIVQIWPVEKHQLPQWIATRLQQQGHSASPEALQLLAERVEGNLLAAQQEIDKLALAAAEGEIIDAPTVARCVADSARYHVFELSDAMLNGDGRGLGRIILGLQEEGAEATIVLWAISRDIRRLMHIRQAMDQGQHPAAAMDKQGIWKKQQGPFSAAVKRLSTRQLTAALNAAREIDLGIKGMAPIEPWRELLTLGLIIAGRPLFMNSAE